jgi:hypothetical protein
MAAVALALGADSVCNDRERSPYGARAPLRIGVFAGSRFQPRWAADGLRKIVDAGIGDVVFIAETGRPREAWPFLWRAYCTIDSRLFGSHPDPLETVDLAAQLPRMRVLSPPPGDAGPASVAAWLSGIRAMDLDVVFALDDAPCDSLDRVARYGVWRYCFGADASETEAVAAIRGVTAGTPVTASGLRVRLPGAEDRLIYQSWSRTFPMSLARTRHNLLPKTGEFAWRALDELRRSGAAWLKTCAPIRGEAAAEPASIPGTTGMLWRMSLLGSRIARRALQKLVHVDQWFLAYRFGGDVRWRGDLRQYVCLMPPKDRFWADPFPILRDGRYYIFFEELPFASGKAHISAVEVAPDGTCSRPVRVLERAYHLSYPFLIEQDGELFMVPETGRNRAVELYRCTRFPDQWTLEHVLMDEVFFTDATLHRADDRWWMFVNGNVAGAEGADELFLFHADRLTGEWRPHRRNPVKSDVRGTRPAGRLYRRGTELYRPAQIGVPLYGSGVSINRVLRLTPDAYAEEEVERVLPSYPQRLLGIHTLNRAGELCVMDGFVRRSRLHADPIESLETHVF